MTIKTDIPIEIETETVQERVSRLIRELGDTPDQIARSLATRGVKGSPGFGEFCALAEYLRREGYPAAVGPDIYVYNRGGLYKVEHTRASIGFVFLFDSHFFQDLIG